MQDFEFMARLGYIEKPYLKILGLGNGVEGKKVGCVCLSGMHL